MNTLDDLPQVLKERVDELFKTHDQIQIAYVEAERSFFKYDGKVQGFRTVVLNWHDLIIFIRYFYKDNDLTEYLLTYNDFFNILLSNQDLLMRLLSQFK